MNKQDLSAIVFDEEEDLLPQSPSSSGEDVETTAVLRKDGREPRGSITWRLPNRASRSSSTDRSSTSRRPSSAPSVPNESKETAGLSDTKAQNHKHSASGSAARLEERYWDYLHEQLDRAIQIVYDSCDQEASVQKTVEVIRHLKRGVDDFTKLLDKLHTFASLEEDPRRSRSVAWDVPTRSPTRSSVLSPAPPSPSSIIPEVGSPPAFELEGSSIPNSPMVSVSAVSAQQGSSKPRDIPVPSSSFSSSSSFPSSSSSSSGLLQSNPQPLKTWLAVASGAAPYSAISPPKRQLLQRRLTSPERTRKSPQQIQERQAKAELQRKQLELERTNKARVNNNRSREVSRRQQLKLEQAKNLINEKLEKADQLHEEHILNRKKKAETENDKVNELDFIRKLSVEDKKHEIDRKLQESEARRQENLEAKKQKQLAAEERRRRIEQHRQHDPRRLQRFCRYCDVEILPEDLDTHANGKKHKQAMEKIKSRIPLSLSNEDLILTLPMDPVVKAMSEPESDISKAKQEDLRKQTPAIRNAISAASLVDKAQVVDSPNKGKLVKLIEELNRQKTSFNASKPDALEKTLADLERILTARAKSSREDALIFRDGGGLSVFWSIVSQHKNIPNRCFIIMSRCVSEMIVKYAENAVWALMTGNFVTIVDMLEFSLSSKEYTKSREFLIDSVTSIITLVPDKEQAVKLGNLLIDYLVHQCIIHLLHQQFATVQANADKLGQKSLFLIERILARLSFGHMNESGQLSEIASSVLSILKEKDFLGVLSVLVSILLHKGPRRSESAKQELNLTEAQYNLILVALRALNQTTLLDRSFLQELAGSDTNQVETYHIVSYLLDYCSAHFDSTDNDQRERAHSLLHEILLFLGYITLNNSRTQEIFLWGKNPTILQRLCALPFSYFTDVKQKAILFPTLIIACYENQRNKLIVDQEISLDHLSGFLKEELQNLDTKSSSSSSSSSLSTDIRTDINRLRPSSPTVPLRFRLSQRFPAKLWADAIKFFESS